jgi:hypothetical protein
LRNYPYVFIGKFLKGQSEKEWVKDDTMPGGAYIVREFLIEKALKERQYTTSNLITVKVPADLVNYAKTSYKEKRAKRSLLEEKMWDLKNVENKSPEQQSQLDIITIRVTKAGYFIKLYGYQEKLNYDYSLNSEIRYFFALKKPVEGHFSLLENPSKLIPFDRGHFIDRVDINVQ